MNPLSVLLLTSAAAGVAFLLVAAGRAWERTRGTRLVTCPGSGQRTAVALRSFGAALSLGGAAPRVGACSRWPERASCGQECLAEIEQAPDGCLVRAMVERFYAGHACVGCGRPFGAVTGLEHRHALLSEEGTTLQWDEVDVEELPRLFLSHQPLCWSCHVLRSLKAKRPGLLVVRPEHPDPQQLL